MRPAHVGWRMDGLLSFLCLLCVLIIPGHSLLCIECWGLDSCTGPTETCQSDHSCGLIYIKTIEGGNITTEYVRSCVPTSKCNKGGSISYTGGTMKMGISCCDTDNCTPPLPQLPADSSQANGLVCPSCRSETQDWCNQQTNIQCTGSEQTCVFEFTIISESGYNVMGCATPTFCDVAEYNYQSGSYSISKLFYCFPATNSSATGTSCVICKSWNSLTCNGSLSVIPPNSRCASAYKISTIYGLKINQLIRTWVPVSKCNFTGSMSTADVKYSMGVSCCDGDGCTPSIPDMKSTSAESNGVQCNTCTLMDSISCLMNTTINCTGQETQCMAYEETTTYGNPKLSPGMSTHHGCGTKSLCDAQNYSSVKNFLTFENRFTCESTAINPSTTTPSNRGNSATTPTNNGAIFLLLSTAATITILHQFNKDP